MVERLYHPEKYKRIQCDKQRCNKSEICAFYHEKCNMELRSVILLLNLANSSERILLLIRRFRPLMTYTNSWHVSTLMRRKHSFNRWSRFKTMKLKLRKELEQFWTRLPTPQQTRAHLQNSLFKAHFLNLFHRLITTNLESTSLNQSLLSSRRVLKPMIL